MERGKRSPHSRQNRCDRQKIITLFVRLSGTSVSDAIMAKNPACRRRRAGTEIGDLFEYKWSSGFGRQNRRRCFRYSNKNGRRKSSISDYEDAENTTSEGEDEEESEIEPSGELIHAESGTAFKNVTPLTLKAARCRFSTARYAGEALMERP